MSSSLSEGLAAYADGRIREARSILWHHRSALDCNGAEVLCECQVLSGRSDQLLDWILFQRQLGMKILTPYQARCVGLAQMHLGHGQTPSTLVDLMTRNPETKTEGFILAAEAAHFVHDAEQLERSVEAICWPEPYDYHALAKAMSGLRITRDQLAGKWYDVMRKLLADFSEKQLHRSIEVIRPLEVPVLLYALMSELYSQGSYQEALLVLDALRENFPDHVPALEIECLCHWKLDDNHSLRHSLLALGQIAPWSNVFAYKLRDIYWQQRAFANLVVLSLSVIKSRMTMDKRLYLAQSYTQRYISNNVAAVA